MYLKSGTIFNLKLGHGAQVLRQDGAARWGSDVLLIFKIFVSNDTSNQTEID